MAAFAQAVALVAFLLAVLAAFLLATSGRTAPGGKALAEASAEASGSPEAVLLRQLRALEAEPGGRPAAAAELRLALARVHRAAGRANASLPHLEAAKALAAAGAPGHTVAVRLALGEALLELGRAPEAATELEASLAEGGPGSAFAFPANRALGRTRFSLGDWDGALEAYARAQVLAPSEEDRALVLGDAGEAHLRRETLRSALEAADLLQEALDLLSAAERAAKAGADAGGAARTTSQEHRRRLQRLLEEALRAVAARLGPARHPQEDPPRSAATTKEAGCIGGWAPQRKADCISKTDVVPASGGLSRLREEVGEHLNRWDLRGAEATITAALEGRSGPVPALALNLLGRVRRSQERLPEAAELHRQALAAALEAGGDGARDAEEAYEGLSFLQATFHRAGQPDDAVALYAEAVAIAGAAGVLPENRGRKDGERRLRANAWPHLVGTGRLRGGPPTVAAAAAADPETRRV